MMRSAPGEHEVGKDELQAFEGLVHSTARMFAAQVQREEDDLAQELRVRVWRAVARYDPTRSKLTLERYVFMAITNKIKDYKRDAKRERARREEHGVSFIHIEDMRFGMDDVPDARGRMNQQEAFDGRYNFVDHDEVYGRVEEGEFVIPSGVTERESRVLMLLMLNIGKTEVSVKLGMTRGAVDACISALRQKFADWEPGNGSQVISLRSVQPAELSRAA